MNPDTGTTKILVSSSQLRAMLDRQPEVELELVRNAVPQLAELLHRKAQHTREQINKRVEEAWSEIERHKNDKFGLPRRVQDIITNWLRAECRDEAKILVAQEARAMAKEAAEEAVSKAMLKLGQDVEKAITRGRDEVDAYIKEVAEREVLALLRAGKLTVAA